MSSQSRYAKRCHTYWLKWSNWLDSRNMRQEDFSSTGKLKMCLVRHLPVEEMTNSFADPRWPTRLRCVDRRCPACSSVAVGSRFACSVQELSSLLLCCLLATCFEVPSSWSRQPPARRRHILGLLLPAGLHELCFPHTVCSVRQGHLTRHVPDSRRATHEPHDVCVLQHLLPAEAGSLPRACCAVRFRSSQLAR